MREFRLQRRLLINTSDVIVNLALVRPAFLLLLLLLLDSIRLVPRRVASLPLRTRLPLDDPRRRRPTSIVFDRLPPRRHDDGDDDDDACRLLLDECRREATEVVSIMSRSSRFVSFKKVVLSTLVLLSSIMTLVYRAFKQSTSSLDRSSRFNDCAVHPINVGSLMELSSEASTRE